VVGGGEGKEKLTAGGGEGGGQREGREEVGGGEGQFLWAYKDAKSEGKVKGGCRARGWGNRGGARERRAGSVVVRLFPID